MQAHKTDTLLFAFKSFIQLKCFDVGFPLLKLCQKVRNCLLQYILVTIWETSNIRNEIRINIKDFINTLNLDVCNVKVELHIYMSILSAASPYELKLEYI